jgi:hypothetical protein
MKERIERREGEKGEREGVEQERQRERKKEEEEEKKEKIREEKVFPRQSLNDCESLNPASLTRSATV